MTDEELRVREDAQDYYGKEYWLSHMRDTRHFPTIEERARADLPVRCTHWLRGLLRFKLPPGRVLELGAAHGGFVALLGWAGFEAVGLEMSPWVVDFARRTFGIPMLHGPVEDQDLAPASLDAIVLNDVLEHLPDPETTMAHCAGLLKPDGLLVIQTPQFPDESGYAALQAEDNPFLAMMSPEIANEHLYLFSRRSLGVLLERLGLGLGAFEVPAHVYDMYAFASRQPCPRYTEPDIRSALEQTPSGYLAAALIDAQADMQHQVDNGRVAFEELQQQARAALKDLAWHVEQAQAGVALLRRELEERYKEIADAALVIEGLRRRLADRDDLSTTAIQVARKLQNVARRFPRLNRVVHKLLPRSKAAPAPATDN